MLGLGIWQGDVTTSVLSGTATVEIFDNNGEYGFNVSVNSLNKIPKFHVYDIQEGNNSLSGKAKIELMGGISAKISVVFTSPDTFVGDITVPFFGKVPIENGRRIG